MKTYTHNLLSAAVVAAITFSGAAIADEYQTLETTTVTAGRFEQDLMETPMSVSRDPQQTILLRAALSRLVR